ncbi:MAG TPA: hypothetical protein DHW82_08620 [Spirochaetia bacterium]|nr:MAG: hypothetical protein A2Y41_04985 [Spirochaetes bacterium GWB1_36_13]HCL57053.1 hypothetical protein [Spirochaetia bacterium]
MHKNKILGSILLLTAFFVFSGCAKKYNTNFKTPPSDADFDQVFPVEIDSLKRDITQMSLPKTVLGFTAKYGTGEIEISVIQTGSPKDAIEFYKSYITPKTNQMPSRMQSSVNQEFQIEATDQEGRLWYIWNNKNWIFMINASNKSFFDKAVEAFPYIAKWGKK